MQAVYRVQAEELDIDFLESVKKMFKQKTVEISIIDEDEEDAIVAKAIEISLADENVSKEELYKALNAD